MEQSGPKDSERRRSKAIKRNLASRDPKTREEGLAQLDTDLRAKICGLIRQLADAAGWGLQSDDLADIWQETLLSIWNLVEKRKFKEEGSLDSFVRTIAWRRALDLYDGRRRFGISADDSQVEDWRVDGAHRIPEAKQIALIRKRWRKLTKTERLVMTHHVRLCFNSGLKKLPTARDVLESLQNSGDPQIAKKVKSVNSVSSAITRARKKLDGGGNSEGIRK